MGLKFQVILYMNELTPEIVVLIASVSSECPGDANVQTQESKLLAYKYIGKPEDSYLNIDLCNHAVYVRMDVYRRIVCICDKYQTFCTGP